MDCFQKQGEEMHIENKRIELSKMLDSSKFTYNADLSRHEALVDLGKPGRLSSFAVPSYYKYVDIPSPKELAKRSKEEYRKLIASIYGNSND
jgi:hypothetical protein